jgi:hypothetical protein
MAGFTAQPHKLRVLVRRDQRPEAQARMLNMFAARAGAQKYGLCYPRDGSSLGARQRLVGDVTRTRQGRWENALRPDAFLRVVLVELHAQNELELKL